MTQIYAVDSIMGTGKTNWAIKHMNCHKEQRFIYCTPFIDEVNRILSASPHSDSRQKKTRVERNRRIFLNSLRKARASQPHMNCSSAFLSRSVSLH